MISLLGLSILIGIIRYFKASIIHSILLLIKINLQNLQYFSIVSFKDSCAGILNFSILSIIITLYNLLLNRLDWTEINDWIIDCKTFSPKFFFEDNILYDIVIVLLLYILLYYYLYE